MDIRNVGTSGLRVSLVGLGCNNFGGRLDVAATRRVVDRAIERGITLFDTSDSYGNRGGSETQLGEILGERRKDIVLATKFSSPMDDAQTMKGASRRYIMSAVEASLRRLRTDWIDLYQLHWPDPLTPIEETLRALDDLVRQGKVRYVGCSNLAAWQVVDAAWTSRHHGIARFVSAQNEYSALVRDTERELFPALEAYGMGFLPYYPLASGLLTGKYKRGQALPEGTRLATTPPWAERFLTERNWDKVEQLSRFCAERGRTMTELAFGWLASHRVVSSIIAGATKPEQIDANVAASEWKMDDADRAEIDRMTLSS
jgi:aryl-alcohol dehydrogenase-like predicted oxidoreductase